MARRGSSLIKLVVVIAVLAIIIGLLLPAVQKVREASNRARSLSNIRQIGIAIMNYESNFQKFPILCDFGAGSPTGSGICSLHFQILPYIEGGNIYQLYEQQTPSTYYNNDTGAAKTIFKPYVSPADPSAPDGFTSTLPISGVTPSFKGTYATTSYPVNGMAFVPGASWRSFVDGQSLTIMVAERYQVCKLGKDNKSPTVNDADVYTMWGLGAYSNSTAAFAMATPDGDNVPLATPANQMFVPKSSQDKLKQPEGLWASSPKTPVKYSSDLIPGAPGGFQVVPRGDVICDARVPQTPHIGGMLVCMADISTRSISPKISPLTFWSAVTPTGNEILGDDW